MSGENSAQEAKSPYYPYGTSGFRFDEKIMLDIANKIGVATGVLLINKNTGLVSAPKNLGIMITASHNPYKDNGVKIIDETGTMISPEEESMLERIVNNVTSTHDEIKVDRSRSGNASFRDVLLLFGNDTRRSCADLKKKIMEGVQEVIRAYNTSCSEADVLNVAYVDIGTCTTPEFHIIVSNHNSIDKIHSVSPTSGFIVKRDDSFVNYVRDVICKYSINMSDVIVDCANGVGCVTLQRVFSHPSTMEMAPTLINTDVNVHEKLNNECGSDFMMTSFQKHHKKLLDDSTNFRENTLHASFDGDADRIVFYTYNRDSISMITGDNISLLILNYVLRGLQSSKQNIHNTIKIVVVHTGYSNGGFMHAVDVAADELNTHGINAKIDRVMTPIGVKHLIDVAKRYDVGIYFEANGHGSVIVNNHHNISELMILKALFNELIGDAVLNLVGVTHLLKSTRTSSEAFRNLFTERESVTVKIHVKDKNIYKTNYDQTVLTEPVQVVDAFNAVMRSDNFSGCRAFVRPSGTEDILRMYVENNEQNSVDLNDLVIALRQTLI